MWPYMSLYMLCVLECGLICVLECVLMCAAMPLLLATSSVSVCVLICCYMSLCVLTCASAVDHLQVQDLTTGNIAFFKFPCEPVTESAKAPPAPPVGGVALSQVTRCSTFPLSSVLYFPASACACCRRHRRCRVQGAGCRVQGAGCRARRRRLGRAHTQDINTCALCRTHAALNAWHAVAGQGTRAGQFMEGQWGRDRAPQRRRRRLGRRRVRRAGQGPGGHQHLP